MHGLLNLDRDRLCILCSTWTEIGCSNSAHSGQRKNAHTLLNLDGDRMFILCSFWIEKECPYPAQPGLRQVVNILLKSYIYLLSMSNSICTEEK